MKNKKLSTTITLAILLVITVCICLLYIIANRRMTTIMKQSERENLYAILNAQTNMIEEYIDHQEHLLTVYSKSTEVKELLKDTQNQEKIRVAQEYTEKYYGELDNWEGLYIGEWNTHVIAHSNPKVVGITTREGEPLKELQRQMSSRKGFYNAGMIVSPASQELVLSLYCPVFDDDGKTILGYVGGGPFSQELKDLLKSIAKETNDYYMINVQTRTYIFAQEDSLMATSIQDNMLLSLIDMIYANRNRVNGDKDYVDEVSGKSIAAYKYLPEYDWAVVSCNSEDNIYADVNRTMKVLGIICLVCVFVICVLAWILIRLSTKPLKYVESSILQLKELKLEKDHKLDKYINCRSEISQIATAIDSLYDSIRDMLETEKEKQIAIAASESKANFLANMSHEIRTPINTVIGMNEMILRENQDEAIKEYAHNIKSASQMLLGLINDVLDFSKMEAGKLQVIPSEYHVASMLMTTILGIKPRMNQKRLEFILDIDESIPSVLKGDEIRIKQILNNLLSNAVKYTERGSVTLTVRGVYEEKGFGLFFSVKDTGIGIRSIDMERLFDSFMRLEMSKNRYIEGTGLGLNIAKQLVECMDGMLNVQSEYGEGSCFSVQIPQEIVNEAPMGQLEQSYQESIKEKKDEIILRAPNAKVLVVDDNKMNLTVIGALLKRTEVQLDYATGGEECLEKTEQEKYDLILMDHMMPEPDGVQTLRRIRENKNNPNHDTHVIVLTANAIEGAEEQYRKAGFSDYLSKPVVVEQMERMLAKYLM